MNSPREALDIVLKNVASLGSSRRPLEKAMGYYLAEPIKADRDLPPADRTAMDGYAIRSGDFRVCPFPLRLVGEVAAGSPARPEIGAGMAARVLTGANIPPGADTVVMVEYTGETGGEVIIHETPAAGAHIIRRGENARQGEVLLKEGTHLGASQIGICAAVGVAEPLVHDKPGVEIICTGLELREACEAVEAHECRNSNGLALRAALAVQGFTEISAGLAPDELVELTTSIEIGLERNRVVMLTGGVSVGKYDLVREAVEKLGAEIKVHGVTMKPGKPFLFAVYKGSRFIFGLPGNPLSTLTGFHEFVLPCLRKMSGSRSEQYSKSLSLPLNAPVRVNCRRTLYSLASLERRPGGTVVNPIAFHSSSDLIAGGRAEGVIMLPSDRELIPAGTIVEFKPWGPMV